MADAFDTLRRCISSSVASARNEGRVSFHDAITALRKIAADPSPQATAMLRDVAVHPSSLRLTGSGHAAHMVSAEGHLRALAASELASRDAVGHLETLASVAFGPGEEHVRSSARFHFRNALARLSRQQPQGG